MKIEKWDEINGSGTHEDRLEAFLESADDSYAILQLKRTDETVAERFASRKALDRLGIEPCFDHYEVVYIAPLENADNQTDLLEGLYEKFNLYCPESFRGHKLSVSDIVVLKQHDALTCHYVDSVGFAELPKFLKPKNHLKYEENYEILKERLEKQNAKKPLGVDLHGKESGNIHKFVCPICENFLANRRKVNEANDDFIPNYCPVCGQKIDWSKIKSEIGYKRLSHR